MSFLIDAMQQAENFMTRNASSGVPKTTLMHNSLLTPAFYGWLYNANSTQHSDEVTRNSQNMRTALNTRANFVSEHSNNSFLGSNSYLLARDNLLVTIIGKPEWYDTTLAHLANEKGHAEALLHAYGEHGQTCSHFIHGSFAFVIIDSIQGALTAGVDRLASIPLYYAEHMQQGIIFGTSAGALLAHDAIDEKLNPQALYNYVYFHMVPSPVSTFENIKKMQAAHSLHLKDGVSSIERYWTPSFKQTQQRSFDDMCNELRRTLKDSVKKAINKDVKTAAFLSGGLDSSTVTGMLSELSDSEAHAYSIGFSAEGYDEMAFARITAKHFGVKLHEYYVTPEDVVAALPSIATSYDEPFGNSSALPAYFCAKEAAKDSVQRLLAGDGGDELFAGNERYAKQKVFEQYSCIPKPLRTALFEPVLRMIPGQIPLVNKARSYVNQANTSLPGRMQNYNFLNQHAPNEIFNDAFINQISTDYPLELLESVYQAPENASALSRMLYLDWQFTLADNDLCKVSHMCALAGVEVAYPMLDDSLLTLAGEIPDQWKLKGQQLRYFYKQALTGWLPQETITKKKQGFGLPFGVWMQTHKPLQELAYDSLVKLKNRPYFRAEFLDKLIKLHREGHAVYYGELIWILTVLELWLEAHGERP
ncbi:asparagine synthase (glutamine-hydrolysing) [Neptunomonas qingdaonensis]|uniref:asparagine synthase (glutamine-hydrolyzing) n=3 Tax=Neptunomonas qingdaonensis TaxID=1045558 RepID=A0A1I2MTR8_9GAMM|nr:asparagine synthase (glutamine-hydrolysing) [Neptunomonas qingdaonensis]